MVAGVAIPAAHMTPARQRTVWRLLSAAVQSAPRGGAFAVLDCGGGTGSLAVPLAELGATVTVVDISADALAILVRRARESGVAERIRPVQGELESLAEAVPSNSFDLVLAHGVLEAVDDRAAALLALSAAARPGGLVSLVIGNPVAGVLSRVLAGDLAAALTALAASTGVQPVPGPSRFDAAGADELCAAAGLAVEQVHGLGVFTEFAAGRDLSDVDGEALAALEAMASSIAPYRDIANRLHVLARRPTADPA
jgi:SAM-dependent methyltransferase